MTGRGKDLRNLYITLGFFISQNFRNPDLSDFSSPSLVNLNKWHASVVVKPVPTSLYISSDIPQSRTSN
jgi:hypothetical protein